MGDLVYFCTSGKKTDVRCTNKLEADLCLLLDCRAGRVLILTSNSNQLSTLWLLEQTRAQKPAACSPLSLDSSFFATS